MTIDRPSKLIRFYGNAKYALKCIKSNRLILPHVSKFNDPFDPVLDFLTECEGDYDRFKQWLKNSRSKSEYEEFVSPKTKAIWDKAFGQLESYAANITQHMFAVCFCEAFAEGQGILHPRDNLYMWGHYANGHRGMAIEFDRDVLEKGQGIIGSYRTYKINYANELPIITNEELYQYLTKPSNENERDNEPIFLKYLEIVSTKSKSWEPEKEWRLAWHSDEYKKNTHYHKIRLPDGAITSIYLGYRINDKEAKKAKKLIRKYHPRAEVYCAKANKRQWALEWVLIE